MIRIKSNSTRDLTSIANLHYRNIKNYVLWKINNSKLGDYLRNYLTSNLVKIIVGNPVELIDINKNLFNTIRGKNKKRFNSIFRKIFNYDWFSKKSTEWNAHLLAQKLDIRVCPYCNRNYTLSVKNKQGCIIRPEFDHFFPRSIYPLLSLSFYNLIPSCSICNSTLKRFEELTFDNYLHPYLDGFDDDCKFSFKPKSVDAFLGNINEFELDFKFSSSKERKQKIENNIELFKIKEIYDSHRDIINEIILKHYISGGSYLKFLSKEYSKIASFDELFRIAFGNYFLSVDFEKRPLSKLTRDIFDELKFDF